jgi:hypothetical protein
MEKMNVAEFLFKCDSMQRDIVAALSYAKSEACDRRVDALAAALIVLCYALRGDKTAKAAAEFMVNNPLNSDCVVNDMALLAACEYIGIRNISAAGEEDEDDPEKMTMTEGNA